MLLILSELASTITAKSAQFIENRDVSGIGRLILHCGGIARQAAIGRERLPAAEAAN